LLHVLPVRLSLFWRTFALIALLIAVSLGAWLELFRSADMQPRAERYARELASLVNLTRAGLLSATGERRSLLLADLAHEERIRVIPAEAGDQVEHWPDTRFAALVEAPLRNRLGPDTRLAGKVNGTEGLWIGFEIDSDPYWLLVDPQRMRRQSGRIWLGWFAIALVLSVAGAIAISRIINRPLSILAHAIDRVSRGERPPALPDRGPQELAALNQRFSRMSDDLAALEQDRAEALAGISHDIRTPLTRLRMEIEMAGVDAVTRASMAEEIDRIDSIVRQFVDFARTGPAEDVSQIDVARAIQSVVDAFRHAPDVGQLDITVTVAPGTSWRGSATTLDRALANLVENASRYAVQADGRTRIEIEARREPGGLLITVRDHGPGVAPDQLERLLRPFTRADVERNRHGGSGLGLAIVTRLARRQGGDLNLDLPDGGGLRAILRLPDAPATPLLPAQATPARQASA
jgi:two-component system osmolarity sensor histidine kinase EnvZ